MFFSVAHEVEIFVDIDVHIICKRTFRDISRNLSNTELDCVENYCDTNSFCLEENSSYKKLLQMVKRNT
jgi:hypothetical protein